MIEWVRGFFKLQNDDLSIFTDAACRRWYVIVRTLEQSVGLNITATSLDDGTTTTIS